MSQILLWTAVVGTFPLVLSLVERAVWWLSDTARAYRGAHARRDPYRSSSDDSWGWLHA
jgi:hypothetical protein